MYGVIDIGSNTMRLNIYKYDGNEIYLMLTKKITAGLAGYVDGDGNLTSEGIETAIESLNEFSSILDNIDINETFVFATASLRNINNSEEAAKYISDKTNMDIQVVSGEEEAKLGFTGASILMDLDDGLLIDIGGGSTEIVLHINGEIKNALSLPIGSLSMHNKYISDFLPTKSEMNKIESRVLKELKSLKNIELPVDTKVICGVGGTVRATCKLKNAIYDHSKDNKEIFMEDMNNLIDHYKNNRHDFLKYIIKVAPDRLHTILPGMIILNTIGNHYKSKKIIVSDYGVREGYLCKMLNNRGCINER